MMIRLMENKDIPAIAELEKQIFSAPWSENSIRSSFESRTIFSFPSHCLYGNNSIVEPLELQSMFTI